MSDTIEYEQKKQPNKHVGTSNIVPYGDVDHHQSAGWSSSTSLLHGLYLCIIIDRYIVIPSSQAHDKISIHNAITIGQLLISALNNTHCPM